MALKRFCKEYHRMTTIISGPSGAVDTHCKRSVGADQWIEREIEDASWVITAYAIATYHHSTHGFLRTSLWKKADTTLLRSFSLRGIVHVRSVPVFVWWLVLWRSSRYRGWCASLYFTRNFVWCLRTDKAPYGSRYVGMGYVLGPTSAYWGVWLSTTIHGL